MVRCVFANSQCNLKGRDVAEVEIGTELRGDMRHWFAAGLRVPKPYGDAIILDIVRASGGVVMAVSDDDILASILDWGRNEGIFLSPEGACVTAAYDKLLANGFLNPSDRVVLFNTGAGLKYTDMTAEAMKLKRPVVN